MGGLEGITLILVHWHQFAVKQVRLVSSAQSLVAWLSIDVRSSRTLDRRQEASANQRYGRMQSIYKVLLDNNIKIERSNYPAQRLRFWR